MPEPAPPARPRVLLIEDQPSEAERLLAQLCQAGFAPEATRVTTEAEFLAHLEPTPDLVLASSDTPALTARDALRHLAERGIDVPLIVFAEPDDEERAIACVADGATDYVLRDRLRRLGPSVWRALRERQARAEMRDTQEALRASEERYRILAGLTSDYAYSLAVRDDGRLEIEWATDAFTRITGYTVDELAGRALVDLAHPEDRRLANARFRTLLAGNPDVCEYRTITKTGEVRWLRAHGYPIWNAEETRVVRILGAVQDITERKRAEAAQERHYQEADRARAQTRAILDATREGLLLISPERRVVSVNKRFGELFGVSPQALISRPASELAAVVDRLLEDPAAIRARVRALAADQSQTFTQIVCQVAPARRELELFSTPVWSEGGEHLGRLYLFRDVTHQREVDRMKTEFVSLVSHELRTPLTSIKGFIDLLLDGEVGELEPDQREFLGIVKANSDRLVALINDLLDISRIEAGKIELRRERVELGRLIRAVADSLRPQIEDKAQRLSVQVAADLPAVRGDADRLTQVLTNLLSNAHKYTPAGGAITLRARAEDGRVVVEVQDTGIGLSPAEQAKLFTKFFRADNQQTREVAGTGLGLAITRSLVELHGGEIGVTSAPGRGSTFRFTLPAPPTSRATPVPEAPSKAPRARILVVDDEPDIAHLLRRYLERAGYEVRIAQNAAEAVELARTERPDSITLDVRLPDLDGFSVLEHLKRDPATRAIPVLMVSVVPDSGRGRRLGAVDYLTKPVEERVLLDRIGQMLADERARLVLVAGEQARPVARLARQLRRAGYPVVEASGPDDLARWLADNVPGGPSAEPDDR